MATEIQRNHGRLAAEYCKKILPLTVLKSNAGYYLGTIDNEGPCSRESVEYWRNEKCAEIALAGQEGVNWTQRDEP